MRPEDEAWFRNDGTYPYHAPKLLERTTPNVVLFVEQCLEMDGEGSLSFARCYELYKDWCARGGHPSVDARVLPRKIEHHFKNAIHRSKSGSIRMYRGVRERVQEACPGESGNRP